MRLQQSKRIRRWVKSIKMMGARRDNEHALTIACAFVSRHMAGLADYIERNSRVRTVVQQDAFGLAVVR